MSWIHFFGFPNIPTYLVVDKSSIPTHDWTDLYGTIEEAIPLNAPTPYGKDIVTLLVLLMRVMLETNCPEDLALVSLFL